MSNIAVKLNEELNGVELYFNEKPCEAVRTNLKNNGFRWSRPKLCWYAKQNEKTLRVAEDLQNSKNVISLASKTKQEKSKQIENVSLFDRVKFKEGKADISQYDYKFVGSNYTGLSVKDTAKEIRKHLKCRFSEIKFSVTSDHYSIYVTIKQSPYNKDSDIIKAIIKYCDDLLSSYNFDDSDTMTDYFNRHFYKHISVSYDYVQTEQAENIKKDIVDFNKKKAEFEKTEEERKEREYQEYQKKREIEIEEAKKQREIEKQNKQFIYNSLDIVDLEESKEYFVLDSEFANLNKNNTLDQYIEEVEKGDYYLQDVKITKEIHFQNEKALKYFSNMLLDDFDFLENTGGNFTEDQRINSMTDYYNMNDTEKNSVKWVLKGVAIYFNNELKFIVDAQGYSYTRYVGLVNKAKIEKII